MTKPKGAGKALRLTLPGAPNEWHYIPGVPGLFHPQIPSPVDSLELDDEAAQALHENESIHLELIGITETEAKAANKALAAARPDALGGVKAALKDRETAEERDRILANAEAAQAVTVGDDEDNPGQEG